MALANVPIPSDAPSPSPACNAIANGDGADHVSPNPLNSEVIIRRLVPPVVNDDPVQEEQFDTVYVELASIPVVLLTSARYPLSTALPELVPPIFITRLPEPVIDPVNMHVSELVLVLQVPFIVIVPTVAVPDDFVGVVQAENVPPEVITSRVFPLVTLAAAVQVDVGLVANFPTHTAAELDTNVGPVTETVLPTPSNGRFA